MASIQQELRRFSQELQQSLPSSIPLAVDVESHAFQTSAEHYVTTVLKDRFDTFEKELSAKSTNLEGTANSSIASLNQFKRQETEQISEYLDRLKEHQRYQLGLVENIKTTLEERRKARGSEEEKMRNEVDSLKKAVEKLEISVKNVEQETQKKRIRVIISEVETREGYLVFQAQNCKDYNIDAVFAQFSDASGRYVGDKEQCWNSESYVLAAQSTTQFFSQLPSSSVTSFHLCDSVSTIISRPTNL